MPAITQYVTIKNHCISANGETVFHHPLIPFADFSDRWYRHFGVSYPKFHKMDNLSKLGFMGADIMLKSRELSHLYDPYHCGIVLSNRTSSLDTDLRHQRQIQSGPASPAVFVYSLPNIVIGEICIRHGIKGENTFFIESEFNIARQVDYINLLFTTGTLKACIGGWVEFLNEEYELFLYLAEAGNHHNKLEFNTTNLHTLYHLPI